MTRGALFFAAVAMLPAVCGPAIAEAASLELALCGGGAIAIPLQGTPGPPPTEPCCAKGCRAARKRAPGPAEPCGGAV